MKKVLMVSAKANMIQQFNKPNIKILKDLGYDITVATNFEEPGTIPLKESQKLYDELMSSGHHPINIGFRRSPIDKENIDAFRKLKTIIDDGDFDLIHCHSPVGGVLTRWAAREARSRGTKVIYTAHGFHFFKGAPKSNWLFYPIEKFFSKYTDLLITINREDYKRANKFNTTAVDYVPGVGVDTYKITETNVDKKAKRKELNIPENAFLILSVGEVRDLKNHRVIIEAIHATNNDEIYYLICGQGDLEEELQKLVESYNLSNRIFFLGYRNDVNELSKIADVFAFPSKREGLGLAGIEAMAAGLPVLTTNVGGINDYAEDDVTGYGYNFDDIDGFTEGIIKIMKLPEAKKQQMIVGNIERSRMFDLRLVNEKMKDIYTRIV